MESEQGKGTTFHFILPFKKYREIIDLREPRLTNADRPLPVNNIQQVHILLAEDNKVNAMLARQLLSRQGFSVSHVLNGQLALEEVQERHYDLILMDLQMPVMNGIDASIAIRSLAGPVANIPIIAMTAHLTAKGNATLLPCGYERLCDEAV
jgi:CheY-like chemotaxis protein